MFRTAVMMASSLALTTAVVAHAYYLKHQFYPTVVYLTKSSPSMAVLYIQAFVLVFLLGKFMGKVFFGQLRAAEMEHLLERSWYAVTETCLAFTVFRDDFSPRFVALFTLLLFLKCFHWLAEDRVDFMERSPNISWLFHFRIVSLMFLLGVLDFLFVSHAYHSILTRGASVQLVFGFEYVLHSVDLQNENPWDSKAVYMLYTELFTGFIKVLLYMAFMTIMIKVHTFPLFAIRPMYLAMRQFKKAVTDAIMSRRAIRNMNTLYPDATAEELQAVDNVCIICREEMVTGAKRLPCNHIFHTSCLRSWFQRQQTCPTCRMDVLRASLPAQPPAPPEQPEPAQQPPPQTPQVPQPPNFPQGILPPFPPGMFPFWPPVGPFPPVPGVQPANGAENAGAASSAASAGAARAGDAAATSEAAPAGTVPGLPFPPPWMGMPWPPLFGFPPMPVPPAGFAGLTEEELRAMEGHDRQNLEARLQCLQNIHTLLDAAMLQINQYLTVLATIGSPRPAPPQPPAAASSSSSRDAPAAEPTPLRAPDAASAPAAAAAPEPDSTASNAPVAEPLPPAPAETGGDADPDLPPLPPSSPPPPLPPPRGCNGATSPGPEDEPPAAPEDEPPAPREHEPPPPLPPAEPAPSDPPDFERFWRAARDNPHDFTAWTELLQYVEQENHIFAARKAFDAFFAHYPYCYGYWKKYADMERRFDFAKETEEIQAPEAFRGVTCRLPSPLSAVGDGQPEAFGGVLRHSWPCFVRERGVRARAAVHPPQHGPVDPLRLLPPVHPGHEPPRVHPEDPRRFRVGCGGCRHGFPLRQALGALRGVGAGAGRPPGHHRHLRPGALHAHPALQPPLGKVQGTRDAEPPQGHPLPRRTALGPIQAGYRNGAETAGAGRGGGSAGRGPASRRGDEAGRRRRRRGGFRPEDPRAGDLHAAADLHPERGGSQQTLEFRGRDQEAVLPREAAGTSPAQKLARLPGLRDGRRVARAHHRPLRALRHRLRPLRGVLGQEGAGNSEERCVNPLFNYTRYLENHTVAGARSVFQRACGYHLPRKPNIHLLWAAFEEKQGNLEEARRILRCFEEVVPGLAMVRLRRVSLERRQGNLEEAEALLQEAMLANEGLPLASFYAIKLARQVFKVQKNLIKARKVLVEALEKDPENARLYANLLEMEFSADVRQNEGNTMSCFERALSSGLPDETKIVFSQRRVEFLEDFGSSIHSLLTAYDEHQKFLKHHATRKRALENGGDEPDDKRLRPDDAGGLLGPMSLAMGGDMNNPAAYNYWYQQNYGAYSYQTPWNYSQYYSQS
ncbi:uncharacterized protein LOC134154132 isoform X3 [Rhea pennata]|uniref:uncharacterized protein LOC134154132 isoform X3 n=1 Tax=Rhea pennata TaxID=8795 RepID=UPI002E25BDBB